MSTEGLGGLYVETRNYGATAAFWRSLGYTSAFETDHGSGQWVHPSGGPYVFIAERGDPEHVLETYPILNVADSTTFAPDRQPDYARPFEPQHWGMSEMLLLDPDRRPISVQAPLPHGIEAPEDHA